MSMSTEDKVVSWIIGIAIAVVISIVLLCNSVYFVQSGQKGVIKRLGVVSQTVINEGMHFKVPFADSLSTVDVTPQNMQVSMDAYTKDNQSIKVTFNILYLNPAKDIANTVIRYDGKPYENFADPKIQDAFKSIAGEFTATEFVQKREPIRRRFLAQTKTSVINIEDGDPVIVILDTPITNVTFDQEYEQAIRDKQVAQQKAQKAEYVLQQAEVDAQAKIATAKGEAEAIRVKATAINKNPLVVKLEEIAKWNGVYPLNAKVVGLSSAIVSGN